MDLMIDLETMGTANDAVILSIGAVFFDIKTQQLGPTFHAILDRDDQLAKSRTYTDSTMQWWKRQSEEAQSIFKAKGADPKKALTEFIKFYKQKTKVHPWGNGSTFDISIMEDMFTCYGLKSPFVFWRVMDVRTFKRFVGKGADIPVAIGVKHNALDDAIAQAKYVMHHAKDL